MAHRPNDRRAPSIPPPTPFECDKGQTKGWRVEIPGARMLATPAYADGRLFLGGGFGSYEFYAFDAESGRMEWQYQTSDDGPTAAVVEDEFVVFNTESCELEVLTVTGDPVWKQWLGDPLMSMPAVGAGRIYMAYPDSRGDHRHYLACFDLRTGALEWKHCISGEIITAPVLSEEAVYLSTLGGILYCFERDGGELRWKDATKATSSPVVRGGKCYFSQRKAVPRDDKEPGVQQSEHCAWRRSSADAHAHEFRGTSRKADYLDHGKRSFRSPVYASSGRSDASVGFASSKGDAKIEQAMRNLGRGHVSGVWGYQGSKPFIFRDHLYSSMGDRVHAVDLHTEEITWSKRVREGTEGHELLDAILTPPVLVNGKVFVGSRDGEIYCWDAETSAELWRVNVGEPIGFPPAVAQGRVFVTTTNGTLLGIETEDSGDDGWLMWGATAAHNGLEEVLAP